MPSHNAKLTEILDLVTTLTFTPQLSWREYVIYALLSITY